MERSIKSGIKYNFLTDLESIEHELLSDNSLYSLNICFLRRFPYIDGPSFSPYKLYKMSIFEKSVTCSFISGIVLTY